jgi:hypothetical protein
LIEQRIDVFAAILTGAWRQGLHTGGEMFRRIIVGADQNQIAYLRAHAGLLQGDEIGVRGQRLERRRDRQLVEERQRRGVAFKLEDLRRIGPEGGRAERRSGRHRDALPAVGLHGQLHPCTDSRPGAIADESDEPAQRRRQLRGAQIGFVGVDLIVESQNIEHVGGHLEQHHAEVAVRIPVPADQRRELGTIARRQQLAAEAGKTVNLPGQSREARRNVERGRRRDLIAQAAHAPPSE